MSTFLITLGVIVLVIGAMAIGVMLGRKPIGGSCGGLATLGEDCEFGCKKPCSKREARLKAAASAVPDTQHP